MIENKRDSSDCVGITNTHSLSELNELNIFFSTVNLLFTLCWAVKLYSL